MCYSSIHPIYPFQITTLKFLIKNEGSIRSCTILDFHSVESLDYGFLRCATTIFTVKVSRSENGRITFLRNVSIRLKVYTLSKSSRPQSKPFQVQLFVLFCVFT
jgi:hypothetical protein